uniref:Uncharacterized protein n=1 Tax=Glossina palpalis gambiensis TaxID=67801 RepID=A0A1B0AT38_9MUSC
MLCSYTRSPNVAREHTGLRMRGRAIGFEVDFVGLVISAFVSIYGLELMLTVPLIVVITADGLAVILNDAVSSSFKFFKPFKFNVFSLETSCIVLSGAFLKAQGLCRSSDCDCCSCLLSIFANFDEWRTAKLFKLNDDLMDSSKFVLCMSSIACRSMQGKIKTFLYSFLNKLAFVMAIIVLVSLGNSRSCKWYLTIYAGDVDSFKIPAVVVMAFALLFSFAFAVSATNSFKRNFCSISVMTPSCSANNFPFMFRRIYDKVLYFAIKASMEKSNSQIIKECDR